MTRRGPRGAENQGEEREKTTGSSRRRGGGTEGRRNTTADSGFFPLSRSLLSLSSADSHTATLCCTQLNVHSSKLSLLPDFTPSPSCPANVSSASY